MAFDGYGLRAPASALTRDRTVYVDSATGNDNTGLGTQAKPWATLQRAWIERMQYLQLRARFVVQLIGAGPYEIDFPMGGSDCSPDGRFIVLGDPNFNVADSGTATGDMVGQTVPCSAIQNGGAANYQWVRFTSGACAGCVFLINNTTANSFTVASSLARANHGAIVNGDTFQMVEPITRLHFMNPPAGNYAGHTINGLRGAYTAPDVLTLNNQPCHWFYGLLFDAAGVTGRVQNSQVGFSLCRFSHTFTASESDVMLGSAYEASGLPGASNTKLWAAGSIFNSNMTWPSTRVNGVFSGSSTMSFSGSRVGFGGGRLGVAAGAIVVASAGFFDLIGSTNANRRFQARLELSQSSELRMVDQGVVTFEVTGGSCVRVTRGGFALIAPAGTFTYSGGTSDAAGFGLDTRGGGVIQVGNWTPTFTGGTAGQDLRTTNVTTANATLNANNTVVGNAADALLGEVLSRVG